MLDKGCFYLRNIPFDIYNATTDAGRLFCSLFKCGNSSSNHKDEARSRSRKLEDVNYAENNQSLAAPLLADFESNSNQSLSVSQHGAPLDKWSSDATSSYLYHNEGRQTKEKDDVSADPIPIVAKAKRGNKDNVNQNPQLLQLPVDRSIAFGKDNDNSNAASVSIFDRKPKRTGGDDDESALPAVTDITPSEKDSEFDDVKDDKFVASGDSNDSFEPKRKISKSKEHFPEHLQINSGNVDINRKISSSDPKEDSSDISSKNQGSLKCYRIFCLLTSAAFITSLVYNVISRRQTSSSPEQDGASYLCGQWDMD